VQQLLKVFRLHRDRAEGARSRGSRFAAMLRSAWIGYANAAMREHAVLGPWGAEGSFPRLSVEPQQG